jgi:glycosyltransferase involved in cell wall biosynthesis
VTRFGIPAAYGARWGMLLSFLRFEWNLLVWLVRNRNTYDMIHAFDLDTGLAAGMICRLFRKKLIYHMLDAYADSHFFSDSLIRRLVHKTEMALINSADAALICTEERKIQIQQSSPKRLEIIHNTPNHAFESKVNDFELRAAKAEVKIAYVGTQCSGRGIEELIGAVVRDRRFELHIGGYGPLDDRIRSAAQQCDRIHFYGKIPYSQTLSLEEQCDLMVALYDPGVSNHRYCAPNKLYEALMLGKPLLMCENTGWDRLFQEENIGYLIPYSQEGIELGLNKLYEVKDQWPAMSEAGRRLYQQRYSWETMKHRIRKIYTEIQ